MSGRVWGFRLASDLFLLFSFGALLALVTVVRGFWVSGTGPMRLVGSSCEFWGRGLGHVEFRVLIRYKSW